LTLPVPVELDPRGVHALVGDVDDSGCVDLVDFNLIRQFFGQSSEQAIDADITGDGRVDDKDYLVLGQHLGDGTCDPAPGALPLLAPVLFGFGRSTNWGAQSAVTATSSPRTQGAFAVEVPGTGYRPVRSVPFSTALFEGLVRPQTNRLAVDVFIPTPAPGHQFWLGVVQVFVSCPSANIFNAFLGQVELTGKPTNQFSTVEFNIPGFVRNAMRSTPARSDFSMTVVVNSNDSGQVLDNLRFR
jgi:hypothetical protein